jgi:aryl-alcohol dehydrogenase-like predicted oxidoreductase
VDARDARDTIRAALDAGINFFDTAPLYGNAERDGISEDLLREGLGGDRQKVHISTKFGRYATENAAPHFHARRARESVEGSLRRLGTDRVEVLFFHSPFGPDDIYDDVWEELDRLRDDGKVRYIGHSISMFEQTEQMARTWAAERRIVVVQVVYSLMNRQASALIADLGDEGVGIVARESLANGFLSGTIRPDTVYEQGHLNARYPREEIEARAAYIDRLRFLVRGEVETMPQAAFRWVLDNPAVTLVLSGASNPGELEDGAAAADLPAYTPEELDHAKELHTRDFQAA